MSCSSIGLRFGELGDHSVEYKKKDCTNKNFYHRSFERIKKIWVKKSKDKSFEASVPYRIKAVIKNKYFHYKYSIVNLV